MLLTKCLPNFYIKMFQRLKCLKELLNNSLKGNKFLNSILICEATYLHKQKLEINKRISEE